MPNFTRKKMDDSSYMRRCFEIANMGLGHVASNPLVGCVMVYQNKIIGEGYHHEFGGPHAEINAINQVKDRSLLKESTMYVSLEPCSHFGKTPPCADAIISLGIPKVVISCLDPNPLVAGKGVQKLKEAGVQVETGLLSNEYRWLNRRFFAFFEKKRPYIILKWAQSLDGFMDVERKNNQATIHWISHPFNRTLVHKWRSEEMAILVGSKTVISDNPQLTVRYWKGKNPLRIIIQSDSQLNASDAIFNQEAKTIRITQNNKLEEITDVPTFVMDKNKNFLDELLAFLFHEKIISLLVEGGFYTLQSFINSNRWDEARVIVGNKNFESGLKAPVFPFEPTHKEYIGDDELLFYKNSSKTNS
jgi:diaminohydroxyphosphoribosylaminopyrimidine deaminase/5-amino-6-(5-phosphoribosylamino)uracil reductase